MTTEQLKQNAAAMLAVAEGKAIQCRNPNYPNAEWADLKPHNASWEFTLNEYRPKPEPVSRPWTASDVPPVCWLLAYETEYLVTAVSELGVWTPNGGGNQMWTWERLRKADVKYSTDRRGWKKCEVTE